MGSEKKILVGETVVKIELTRSQLRTAYAKEYAKDPLVEGALLNAEASQVVESTSREEEYNQAPISDSVGEDILPIVEGIESEVTEQVTSLDPVE